MKILKTKVCLLSVVNFQQNFLPASKVYDFDLKYVINKFLFGDMGLGRTAEKSLRRK